MSSTVTSLVPSSDLLSELAGRMYEGLDILGAIEAGEIKTLDDVKRFLQTSVDGLNRTIQAGLQGEPVMVDGNCCVVLECAEKAPSASA